MDLTLDICQQLVQGKIRRFAVTHPASDFQGIATDFDFLTDVCTVQPTAIPQAKGSLGIPRTELTVTGEIVPIEESATA